MATQHHIKHPTMNSQRHPVATRDQRLAERTALLARE